MKIYAIIVSDLDFYGEYGFYLSKQKADQRFQELISNPDFHWKKYLKLCEKEVIE